jgi:hypothetical protein
MVDDPYSVGNVSLAMLLYRCLEYVSITSYAVKKNKEIKKPLLKNILETKEKSLTHASDVV